MAAAASSRGHLGCGLAHKTWWGPCSWLTIPLLLVLCSLSIAMAKETGEHASEAPILCINNCGFYGSSMTNNMCSKCYKAFIKLKETPAVVEKKQAEASAAQEEDQPTKPPPPTTTTRSNRCLSCGKKVGLTGFQCRCGGTFCSTHRYTDSHRCTFDYKAADREKIAKQNPVVVADKINKI